MTFPPIERIEGFNSKEWFGKDGKPKTDNPFWFVPVALISERRSRAAWEGALAKYLREEHQREFGVCDADCFILKAIKELEKQAEADEK